MPHVSPVYLPAAAEEFLETRESRFGEFYGVDSADIDVDLTQRLIREGRIDLYSSGGDLDRLSQEQREVYEAIPDFVPPAVSSAIRDEWVFLETNSWVVARTRGAFDALVDAGATAVQFGNRQWHRVVARAPQDIPPHVSETAGPLKWIAGWGVGIATVYVATVTAPLPVTGLLAASGVGSPFIARYARKAMYALFDPV